MTVLLSASKEPNCIPSKVEIWTTNMWQTWKKKEYNQIKNLTNVCSQTQMTNAIQLIIIIIIIIIIIVVVIVIVIIIFVIVIVIVVIIIIILVFLLFLFLFFLFKYYYY